MIILKLMVLIGVELALVIDFLFIKREESILGDVVLSNVAI
jgi:hypothetical protein